MFTKKASVLSSVLAAIKVATDVIEQFVLPASPAQFALRVVGDLAAAGGLAAEVRDRRRRQRPPVQGLEDGPTGP